MPETVSQNWVLDGYPAQVSQAEDLLVHGVCPTTLVLVHGPQEHATADHYEQWLQTGNWEGACSDVEALHKWAKRTKIEVIDVPDLGDVKLTSKRHPV